MQSIGLPLSSVPKVRLVVPKDLAVDIVVAMMQDDETPIDAATFQTWTVEMNAHPVATETPVVSLPVTLTDVGHVVFSPTDGTFPKAGEWTFALRVTTPDSVFYPLWGSVVVNRMP